MSHARHHRPRPDRLAPGPGVPRRQVGRQQASGGLPRPQVNVKVCGYTVDCYWPQARVVVELDGGKGHSTERQVARDHGRDLKLRGAGISVRRYARRQVRLQRKLVLADLWAALDEGGRRAA